jgi:hypothetical protein
MTLEEISALEAIDAGSGMGLDSQVVEKLRELGLVYGELGGASLQLTANGLSLVHAFRQSLNKFS